MTGVAIACFFRNARFVGYRIDPARWPRCAAWVDRVWELEPFTKLRDVEKLLQRHPPAEHWEQLRAAGVPVATQTLGTATPRVGVMST